MQTPKPGREKAIGGQDQHTDSLHPNPFRPIPLVLILLLSISLHTRRIAYIALRLLELRMRLAVLRMCMGMRLLVLRA